MNKIKIYSLESLFYELKLFNKQQCQQSEIVKTKIFKNIFKSDELVGAIAKFNFQ